MSESQTSTGRTFVGTYLGLSRRIWNRLPDFLRTGYPGRVYGRHLHALVCHHSERYQNHSTFFLRNRPEMDLMCQLLKKKPQGASLDLCILACSKGAEVYSILWAIKSARPDLKVKTYAIDISREILDFAERGIYSRRSLDIVSSENHQNGSKAKDATWRDQNVSIFERLTEQEVKSMFEVEGDQAKIRPWLKEGITWRTGDATDPQLGKSLGPQEIVVANRFLCHMPPPLAEKCLRNIGTLVKPGGHLFVS